jgi:hypothetical protein
MDARTCNHVLETVFSAWPADHDGIPTDKCVVAEIFEDGDYSIHLITEPYTDKQSFNVHYTHVKDCESREFTATKMAHFWAKQNEEGVEEKKDDETFTVIAALVGLGIGVICMLLFNKCSEPDYSDTIDACDRHVSNLFPTKDFQASPVTMREDFKGMFYYDKDTRTQVFTCILDGDTPILTVGYDYSVNGRLDNERKAKEAEESACKRNCR